MKKIFPAAALIFCLYLLAAGTALAAGTRTGTASAADTRIVIHPPSGAVQAGTDFTVTAELSGNPGFNAVQFTLDYDHDALECRRVRTGTLMNGLIAASNPDNHGAVTAAGAGSESVTGDGILAVITFNAKTDLKRVDAETCGFVLRDVLLLGPGSTELSWTADGASVSQDKPDDSEPADGASVSQDKPDGSKPGNSSGGSASENPQSTRRPTPAATPVPISAESRFTDISGNWAEESIRRCETLGVFDGFPKGAFHPNSPIDRASFITALWNLYGRPDADAAQTPFTDLGGCRSDTRKAIAWAFANGYVNGTSETAFTPGGALTRQAAMKVLFLSAGGESGIETLFTSTYDNAFTDSGRIAEWAKAAMYWGVYNVLITGTSKTTLSPGTSLTGAQMAVILLRYTDRFPVT